MRRFHATGSAGMRRIWYVDRLWEHAAGRVAQHVPLASLDVLDRDHWFGTAHVPTMRAVVEHAQRIDDADLGHPIILGADGRVMDGLHRVAKAALCGHTTVAAVRFDVDPEPDVEEVWDPGSPRAVLEAQVDAWNRGDLEGYLAHVHPEVRYVHGETVVVGRDALREHYAGRAHGTLTLEVLSERRVEAIAVLVIEARLLDWRGRALVTLEHTGGRWWMIADATTTLEPA